MIDQVGTAIARTLTLANDRKGLAGRSTDYEVSMVNARPRQKFCTGRFVKVSDVAMTAAISVVIFVCLHRTAVDLEPGRNVKPRVEEARR